VLSLLLLLLLLLPQALVVRARSTTLCLAQQCLKWSSTH
jgi:hypothetical protein